MKNNLFSMTCVAALLAANVAFAQDKSGSNVDASAEGQQGAVALLAMAQDLYGYGIENKDALSVLNAARIASSIDAKDVEREVDNKPIEGAETSDDDGASANPVDAEQMYADAMELAGGDETIVGMIEDAMAEGSRGRVGGASRTLSRLRAGRTDVFAITYRGGQLAELAIIGDGDADLDLLVTDENGNTICVDQSYSDQLYCSWTPIWDGQFLVGVQNMGRVRNSYYLLTN